MRSHFNHWPRRVPHTLTVPATSLWDNLETSARRYPDKAALLFFGNVTSYRELAQGAERLAAHLHASGVRKGDRVILLMQNLPQLVMAHFAILRANAVVVPVNPMNLAQELEHYITDGDVKVAITTADLGAELVKASNALPAGQGLQQVVVTQVGEYLPPENQREFVPEVWQAWLTMERPALTLNAGEVVSWKQALACTAAAPALAVGPQDLSVLPYTSGTTGLPKGCMHTHSSIMFNAIASAVWGSATSENVTLTVIPMFHITGMVSVMHCSIYVGATMVLMPRWDRELAGRLISQYKVTNWTNIPTMVIDLFASPNFQQFDLSSLTYIGGGGAAMPQAVAQRLFEAYGLRYQEGYGLTETAAPSHNNPPEHAKQQCLGIPFISTDARVVDPDTLQEMPVGEQGEIVVCGPQVFQGYWRNEAATRAVFVEIDGQRFFRTGDLGRVDEDGYFFITDRLKRMINASGFKVWPAEVEALMFRHPAIQEACVIAAKDAYRGETVKAVVVLRASHQGQETEESIIAWCRDNMAAYKVPRLVSFVDALPKSGSGKVMWRLLQEAETATA
ncbi:long-chain fatty acid--CoA ligase [Comamonas aquatica]|uniref:Long-chain fatty acid--CoA ligase n=1 Tax=Comamonas aquatica TaxID=225991 RepID=A0AA42L197_9BURK|nr:long-chain fatty acid--CoA ligase [Comamonas aquatica]MDH0365177.1 long-chain fatty acid--CoA ligase [Comamonas aquatica]MDH0900646.1 long-chain fatty acid--CoA ligase [Comamonas aquatica]MDH1766382.1 long-chain fatty acid--CoA ligase [Comamonas aquatica]